MNGVRPGDRVWIFRSESGTDFPELAWRNIGKTLRVIREAGEDERGPDGPSWYAEALEPCVCSVTGEVLPAGYHGVVLKSCVKPLNDPDAGSESNIIQLLKEMTS